MRNALFWLAAAMILLSQFPSGAQVHRDRLPNIDKRSRHEPGRGASNATAGNVSSLRAAVPSLRVEFHEITGAPRFIGASESFLTELGGEGKTVSSAVAARYAGDPDQATKAFIEQHRALFGHGAEMLAAARVTRETIAPKTGLRTMVWQQQRAGIPIFEAVLISHTTQKGELVNLSSGFIRDPESAAGVVNAEGQTVIEPVLSAREAIRMAAADVGDSVSVELFSGPQITSGPEQLHRFTTSELPGEISASLKWLPMGENELRLCWDVTLTSRARGEMFRFLVDAAKGEIIIRRNLTQYISDASYRVYTSDSPTPMSPGHSTPLNTQPPLASRVLVTLPALSTNASPLGWITDGGNETVGNNVDAHTDRNDDDLADVPRPQGSPHRTFDFAMDPATQSPTSYSEAAVVQLFYTCNWVHDRLYELGFTESAGNFQNNNFDRGGLGNDAIQADAQDGGGYNNANFSTPMDGSPGRMQMYIFNGPNPDRDGDFDTEIVIHEYVHGLSNRRVGGGIGMSALQSEGMGEGWSDFYSLALLSEAGDDPHGCYAAGAYATYQFSGLTANYYYGIRRYPYTTDMTKNPLTFRDIDPNQADPHSGVPKSPLGGGAANEVHNMGEVWCAALWDARANLIGKHGGTIGNELILQLVTDGMNLAPANPNFLQARDAILQADLVATGGANRAALWTAFAKRGMGFSASSPGSSSTFGLVEAFDVPDALIISPSILSFAGPVGGPFTPGTAYFGLTNNSTNQVSWQLGYSANWLSISPLSGVLNGNAGTNVAVILTATNFPPGNTTASVMFTNLTSGAVQSRSVRVSAVGTLVVDDFDPGIELSMWSSFGGMVGSTVLATNHGGSVSGLNALWFGDDGTRSATTVPINTTQGGSISFYLRYGSGALAPWEQLDDLLYESVVLEYSTNDLNWVVIASFNTNAFANWTAMNLNIPAGALSPATSFRWRQVGHSGMEYDHWAIDNVIIQSGPMPPIITRDPQNLKVVGGTTASLDVDCLGSPTLAYQWQFNGTNLPGATNRVLQLVNVQTNQSGAYRVTVTNSHGSATSSNAQLAVIEFIGDEFFIVELSTNNSRIMEHGGLTGDDRGGIAASADHLFYTGDSATARFALSDLSGGASLTRPYDALVSDLRMEQVYSLGNGTNFGTSGGYITTLIPLNGSSLQPGTPITLSQPIYMTYGGIFSGFGRVVLWNGSRVYDIAMPSGVVMDLGPLVLPAYSYSESWAVWGVAEWSEGLSLVYVRDYRSIVRTAVPSGVTTELASFISLSDMACITVSPLRNRWYFHHEGGSQFGGGSEIVGYADAAFVFNSTNPPTIRNHPASVATKSGTNVFFNVSAFGGSLSYQWRKDGADLIDGGRVSGARTAQLALMAAEESDSGVYSVLITNRFGSVLSSNATLLVSALDHFEWAAIPSPQAAGVPFVVSVSAKDYLNTTVTSFSGVVSFTARDWSGRTETNILGGLSPQSSSSGNYTVGYRFTPSNNLSVTHVRSYSGNKVSIWTDAGVLIASQTVTNLSGSWMETPLAAPVELSAGTTYRVGLYTGGNPFYYRTDGTGTFPHGNIIQSCQALGDSFPANVDSVRWWLVDLRYSVGTLTNVPVTPGISGAFTNGIWTGAVAVQGVSTGMVLHAQHATGVDGESDPFEVMLQNDVSLTMTGTPQPVMAGGNLSWNLTVNNSGPITATGVAVTNFLSAGTSLQSVALSQGSYFTNGNTLVCVLGSVGAGSNCTISIVVVPGAIGVVSNSAIVTRLEADAFNGNNVASAAVTVIVPTISISDTSIVEGNFSSNPATFMVSLNAPGNLPVTASYATMNGSAFAGSDYGATNGTIQFSPGETNKLIVVPVFGDVAAEPDETFYIQLSGESNGQLADATGECLIVNDEVPAAAYVRSSTGAPWSEVSNEAAMARVFGTNNWRDLRYETVNTASLFSAFTRFVFLEGSDHNASELETFLSANLTNIQTWVSNGGSLFINSAPNEGDGMNMGFDVVLTYPMQSGIGMAADLDHSIFVGPFTPVGQSWTGGYFGHSTVSGPGLETVITNSSGGVLLGEKVVGRGRILFGGMTTDNFHSPKPQSANLRANILAYLQSSAQLRFEWSQIPSPQIMGVPFTATISAQDSSGEVVTNFNESVVFSAVDSSQSPVQITPQISANFTNGIWSGEITVLQPAVGTMINAQRAPFNGTCNAFDVAVSNDLYVAISDSPDPISTGTQLTYSISVGNTGPAASMGVILTNFLPSSVSFISATASQGTWTNVGGTVVADLGTVPGGSNATVTITVVPTVADMTLQNSAVAVRAEADAYLPNNAATASTLVSQPEISIADAAVAEGNAGTNQLLFTVSLSAPSAKAVSAQFNSAAISATAGQDYLNVVGSVSISPGATNQTVAVPVIGDLNIEPDENLSLYLYSVSNALAGPLSATGWILNDDGLPGHVDHFVWATVPSPQAANLPFNVSIAALDRFNGPATNFNGAVNLSAASGIGASTTNTILRNITSSGYSSGTYTLGLIFTPTNEITVTHFRSHSGTKVSLWNNNGTLIASKSVSNLYGTAWMEVPLDAPVTLQAGTRYRLSFYTGGGNFHFSSTVTTNPFPHGIVDPGYCYSSTDSFPSTFYTNAWFYLVDLRYTAGSFSNLIVHPSTSGNFTNGIWSGSLAIDGFGTNVVLAANDGNGHLGSSNPFEVGLQDDVGISISTASSPVSVNIPFTYQILVRNTGPSIATGVVISNQLPASANLVSAEISQGSWSQSGGFITGLIDVLDAGSNAVLTITVTPTVSGVTLTNLATVSRAETDSYPGNNSVLSTIPVALPQVYIGDASAREGNIGQTNLQFDVRLTAPSDRETWVSFYTSGFTAQSGVDYLYTNGVLHFPAGVTNRTVTVRVLGDAIFETDEAFYVYLSDITNATLLSGLGVGTIVNDDGLPGEVFRLDWSGIPSLQFAEHPFVATITVRDLYGDIVTSFSGELTLSARVQAGLVEVPMFPTNAAGFTNGIWSGMITIPQPATNVVLRADDGDGHIGSSVSFHVVGSNQPPFFVQQPTNAVGYLGGGAVFSASALATPPLAYQWRFNGVPVPNATNANLVLTGLRLDQAGLYSVSASNDYGVTSSAKAALTVRQVAAWGAGTTNSGISFNYGQSMVPDGLTNAIALDGGLYHSIALKADGSVAAWGITSSPQGGIAAYGQSVSPPIGNVTAIAAGGYHNLALRSDGTVYAWGAGTNPITYSSPHYRQSVVPASASNIVAVAAGNFHSLALRGDGRVIAWGYNGYSQTNVPPAATSNVIAIAAGGDSSVALRSDGTIVRWGYTTAVPAPNTNFVAIAAGRFHVLALRADGTCAAIGQGVPIGLSNLVEIAAGYDHSVGLTRDGRIVTWGVTNTYGRHAIPALTNVAAGVACGDYHSLAWLHQGPPVIKVHPMSQTPAMQSVVNFRVLAVGPNLRYQWQFNGTNIYGATNPLYAIQGVFQPHLGGYRVVLSNHFGSVTSAVAKLNLNIPLPTALDAPALTWLTSGHKPWAGQLNESHDGIDAARAGELADSQQAMLTTTVAGPGSVSFWWKVSSEEYFDVLSFSVDFIEQDAVSGEPGWQRRTVDYGPGVHSLRWIYQKDRSVSSGLDSAWLDQVSIVTNPPLITLQPGDVTAEQGTNVMLGVSVIGAPPLTYQWRRDGALVGGNQSTLELLSVDRRDSGLYQVVATNPGGSTVSSNALLRVWTPQVIGSTEFSSDGFVLVSRDRSGVILNEADLSGFELQISTNLVDWAVTPATMSITNGQLRIQDNSFTNDPVRFYRVVEH